MILSTYYRQHNYHPLYSLRGMMSLVFQIPFFIAAYHFLSELALLQGSSFLFLSNLGTPDALITIASYKINMLPIVMTAVNILSTVVYTRNLPLKEKIQLYGMALLFLLLLYDSPAGLVFYWTLNNLFSLGKNIFVHIPYNKKLWYYLGLAVIAAGGVFSIVTARQPIVIILMISIIIGYVLIPLIVKLVYACMQMLSGGEYRQIAPRLFYISAVGLAVLTGVVIPSSLIASSVQEFSYTMQYQNPFYLLWITGLQSAGFVLIWPAVLYRLAHKQMQSVFALFTFMVFLCAVLNVFVFQGNYGSLTSFLSFPNDEVLHHSIKENFINLLTLSGAVFCCILLAKSKYAHKSVFIAVLLCLSCSTLSVINMFKIASGYQNVSRLIHVDKKNKSIGRIQKVYHLSKTHKNILIFMLDRMPGIFIPSIFEDFPDTARHFTGFTLYPNTVSFGGHTYIGAPALYGGYEYTPAAFRQNTDSQRDMYNESLCVMPRLFSEAGWNTVITDASLANHSWIPDNSIFEPYKGVKALNMEGKYVHEWVQKHKLQVQNNVLPFSETLRNTIRFSFIKASPYFLRRRLYNKGRYLQSSASVYGLFDFIAKAAPLEFIEHDINTQAKKNCFNLIVNNLSHTPLSAPQARLFCNETFIKKCEKRCANELTLNHYISDAYLFETIGNMLHVLKENQVYDNTRIIFVADHGYGNFILKNAPFNTDFKNKQLQQSYYMPILMMKDFYADGALALDDTFMTNADVPILAISGLENAAPLTKNPFTGKSFLEMQQKDSIVIANILDDDVLNIHLKQNNIFVESNWEKR